MATMPQIAMGFQMPQIQLPNQGNTLALIAQLQQAQGANELRRLQAAQLMRAQEQENALLRLTPEDIRTNPERLIGMGAQGRAAFEAYTKGQREQRQAASADVERQLKQFEMFRNLLGTVADQPSYDKWVSAVTEAAPDLKGVLPTQYSPEVVRDITLKADERYKLIAPKPTEFRFGDRVLIVDMNPNSPTYKQEILSGTIGATPQTAEQAALTRARTEEAQAGTAARRAELAGTLPARPAGPTELARLLAERAEIAARDPNSPQLKAYDDRIARLGQAPTTIIAPGEKAEETARGAALVKEEELVSTAAQSARRSLASIQSAQRVLDAGFRTGFGTETKAVAASFLGALGVKEANKFATSAQTFLKAAKENVLARQLEQKGVQTNQDADRIEQTFAQLGNTPEANQFILDVAKTQAKIAIEQDQFYRKWLQDKGSLRGARDAWFESEGDKSIFDRPELERYRTPPAASGSAPMPAVINFNDLRPR